MTEEENPVERTRLARFAALRLLFGGSRQASRTSGYVSLDASLMSCDGGSSLEHTPCRCIRAMGAARRTFCLVVAFDVILAFVLWGIAVKTGSDNSLMDNFIDEVVHYSIYTSLFDTFLCGLIVRFIPLTLAYAIFRIRNPSVIAVTTFVTCLFVIVKVFTFHQSVLGYVIVVEQFLIAWIEVWILDFKVLPGEREAGGPPNSTDPRVLVPGVDVDSPFHTPEEGSDGTSSPINTSSYEDTLYRQTAMENWERARKITEMHDGWKVESVTSDGTKVFSRQMEKLGKVLRVEASIDAGPADVFHVTSVDYEGAVKWNKTVIESRVLQVLGEDTDVTYNVTAEAGRGAVSSRDFVTVRHWRRLLNGNILSVAGAVEHPRKPVDKRYVRGENRLSAFLYRNVPGRADACLLGMYVSTDIKGWIPQVLVDQALTGVLVDFIICLKDHIRTTVSSYQSQQPVVV